MQSAWPHVALLMASPRLCFLLWLLQLSQSLSSSSGGIGGAYIFLAWLSSIAGKRPVLKEIGILLRWGGVSWYGVLVPMETDTSREPEGLGRKVNSKAPQKPKEGTFASDRLAKNWVWRRGKYSHKGGGLHMGRIVSEAPCLRSVWQQEIVGFLTYRQIKCHLSKNDLYGWVLAIVRDGKRICEEAARNGKSELKWIIAWRKDKCLFWLNLRLAANLLH